MFKGRGLARREVPGPSRAAWLVSRLVERAIARYDDAEITQETDNLVGPATIFRRQAATVPTDFPGGRPDPPAPLVARPDVPGRVFGRRERVALREGAGVSRDRDGHRGAIDHDR